MISNTTTSYKLTASKSSRDFHNYNDNHIEENYENDVDDSNRKPPVYSSRDGRYKNTRSRQTEFRPSRMGPTERRGYNRVRGCSVSSRDRDFTDSSSYSQGRKYHESLNRNTESPARICKKRWRNIRDNYYKQKENTQKSTETAGTGNHQRNPILDQLGFLDVEEHERRVSTNTDTQLNQIIATENSQDQLDEISNDGSMEDYVTDTDTSTASKPTKALSNMIATKISRSYKGTPSQKRKKNLTSEILSAMNKSSSSPPDDEIDILFKSLAKTVKKFPPLLRTETKCKLFQVISDAELRLLQPGTSSSPMSTMPLQSSTNWDQQAVPYDQQQFSYNSASYIHNFQINN